MNKIIGDQNVDRQKVVDKNKDELKLVSKDLSKIRKQCEMVTEKCFEVDKERISCEEKQDKLKLHIDKLENNEIIGARKEVKKAEAERVRKTGL